MKRGTRRTLAIVLTLALPLALAAAPAAAKKPKKGKPGPVSTATATASGSGNQTIVTATATCAKGTRAVGGGFSSTAPGNTGGDYVNPAIHESRKVGQTAWRVSLQIGDDSPPTNVSLTTSAYCRRGAPATKVASLVTQLPAVNGISPVTPVICEPKTKATGGGFATQPLIIPVGSATGWVLESYLSSPTSWVNRAVTSANGSGVLTSEVYCAKASGKKKKSASASKKKGKGFKPPTPSFATSPPTAATTGSITTATATCSSRSVIGGGYRQPTASFPGPPPRSVYTFESQRNGSTWRVSGITVTNEAVTIDSMALCG